MPDDNYVARSISKPKLLIGEGNDEWSFFKALLSHLHIEDVQVEQYGGKDNLGPFLRTLPVRPGYQELVSLGITRDADENPESAFESVSGALQRAGIAAPSQPGDVTGENPQVSVWILPGGDTRGMLENILLESVDADPGLICVDEYLQCIHQRTQRQPQNRSKARVHAWLASQSRSYLRIGEAASKGIWPWDSSVFEPLIEFIHAM